MNFLRLLAGPLIGAVIGYCTNYIAVKPDPALYAGHYSQRKKQAGKGSGKRGG